MTLSLSLSLSLFLSFEVPFLFLDILEREGALVGLLVFTCVWLHMCADNLRRTVIHTVQHTQQKPISCSCTVRVIQNPKFKRKKDLYSFVFSVPYVYPVV